MEPIDDPFVSSSSRDIEKVETVDLLEECWFFDNLLDRRRRMLRCYSDPCPSSNFSQEMLVRNNPPCAEITSSLMNKLPKEDDHFVRPNLARTPSLPASMGREKVSRDKESEPRISKLTRQASLSPLDTLPPRRTSKGMTQSSSIPRNRPRRLARAESMNVDGAKEMNLRSLNQIKTKKSLSELEFEEVQGFKDLGFTFDKEDLNPSVSKILPGLQEKNRVDSDEDDKVRRPYLSEAWLVQSSTPPIPNWVVKKSAQDMKAQIKFWARAVASNVRQEC